MTSTTPSWLRRECFASYPTQGRQVAIAHLSALQAIPVSLLPIFLVDLKTYDWKFPVEQQEILRRMEFAQSNPSSLDGFRKIAVPPVLDNAEKPSSPERFLAEMSAYLWSSQQMDAYRAAADRFVRLFAAAEKPVEPKTPRLVMICMGRDAQPPTYPLFQKLRKFGQVRTGVRAEDAAESLLQQLRQRSVNSPAPYAHWYVDGGSPIYDPRLPNAFGSGVTSILYPELAPLNEQILSRIVSCIQAGSGPEVLHSELAELTAKAPSANSALADPRLQHFAASLLTEGSGTQFFSTSFVQWTTREILRRVQPETVLARFAPRQRQRPFNMMAKAAAGTSDLDPDGSLLDADMAAYYAYLEMKKLQGAENAAFLAWFEGHSQAFVAGPTIPAGTVNAFPVTMPNLLAELR